MDTHNKPRILLAGFEATPFYKKGGLGDVLGSLPYALSEAGVDARVIIPYYGIVKKHFPQKRIGHMLLLFGGENRLVRIYQGSFPKTNIPIYFLENRKHFTLTTAKIKRIEEYAFFSLAVCYFLQWISQQNKWQADIVHCNDWHTALVPLLLKKKLQSSIPSLLTIHNLLYQGSGSLRVLDLLGVNDTDAFELRRGRPANELNILGEGILHASRVATVSPTYGKEISSDTSRTMIYRYLREREDELKKTGNVVGILNGIDYRLWDPQIDRLIQRRYSSTALEGKRVNKTYLLKEYNLPDRPTFAFIGRMVRQKGLDLLSHTLEHIIRFDVNVIILGKGHPAIEHVVSRMHDRFPTHVRSVIAYREDLAHALYAGADFLLMPSHYEPCGLVQMVAMRYGTIPVAAATGGILDTVEDGKTGFLFKSGSRRDLLRAVAKAVRLYNDEKRMSMIRACMQQDFSWEKSASAYKKVYQELLAPSD